VSLETTKGEFEELLEKFERCLARGNKLFRELTQARIEGEKLSRELKAVWKRVGEEHRSDPGVLAAAAEMLAQMQAVQDRNPSLPIM
jgi:hypothetical protein